MISPTPQRTWRTYRHAKPPKPWQLFSRRGVCRCSVIGCWPLSVTTRSIFCCCHRLQNWWDIRWRMHSPSRVSACGCSRYLPRLITRRPCWGPGPQADTATGWQRESAKRWSMGYTARLSITFVHSSASRRPPPGHCGDDARRPAGRFCTAIHRRYCRVRPTGDRALKSSAIGGLPGMQIGIRRSSW